MRGYTGKMGSADNFGYVIHTHTHHVFFSMTEDNLLAVTIILQGSTGFKMFTTTTLIQHSLFNDRRICYYVDLSTITGQNINSTSYLFSTLSIFLLEVNEYSSPQIGFCWFKSCCFTSTLFCGTFLHAPSGRERIWLTTTFRLSLLNVLLLYNIVLFMLMLHVSTIYALKLIK